MTDLTAPKAPNWHRFVKDHAKRVPGQTQLVYCERRKTVIAKKEFVARCAAAQTPSRPVCSIDTGAMFVDSFEEALPVRSLSRVGLIGSLLVPVKGSDAPHPHRP
jgi:hypothetical protein